MAKKQEKIKEKCVDHQKLGQMEEHFTLIEKPRLQNVVIIVIENNLEPSSKWFIFYFTKISNEHFTAHTILLDLM